MLIEIKHTFNPTLTNCCVTNLYLDGVLVDLAVATTWEGSAGRATKLIDDFIERLELEKTKPADYSAGIIPVPDVKADDIADGDACPQCGHSGGSVKHLGRYFHEECAHQFEDERDEAELAYNAIGARRFKEAADQ